MQDFIIIANSHFLVKEIIVEACQDKTRIALDGAANKLISLGIMPHVILGDFDSVTTETQHYFGIQKTFSTLDDDDAPYNGHHDVIIAPHKNQSLTDLTKAIHYCDKQHANSITIICATGGRLDHHEGNLRSLRTQYKKDRPIYLHTEQQTLQFIKDESLIFSGEIGDKCGILAFPHGFITSQGLEYEANQLELQFGISDSTCNALIATEAIVHVKGEALLILPPQLKSQRDFMKNSEISRLSLLLRDANGMQSE